MTSRRRWGVVALLCTLVVAAAGCPDAPDGPRYLGAGNTKPHYGGTFTFFHISNVRGMDPHVSFDELSTMANRMLFDGLLDYTPDAKLIPNIAETLPVLQPDGKTYRFALHKGVFFHDSPIFPGGKGRELVADDVRWSLEHLLSPESTSSGFPFYLAIDGAQEFRDGKIPTLRGVKVVDRYTVDITLSSTDQSFVNVMAMPFAYPVPHENYEAHPDDVAQHPVGTGPFVLKTWERGVKLVFDKNKNYWRKGLPYVDHMVYLENVSPEVAAMRFRNGDIDHLHSPRQPDFMYFQKSAKWAPYETLTPQVTMYGFMLNCEMKPFDNVHIRRAFAFAMNREKWAKIFKGKIAPAGQMLPPQLMGYDANLPNLQRYDLAKAKDEMRLAGHPNGLDEPITIMVGENDTSRSYGELAQEDLKAIGIKVNIKPTSFAVYLQESGKPGRVQVSFGGWNQDYPDPSDFLDVLLHSRAIHKENSENRSFYRNPVLDKLLDEARVETDPEKRKDMYWKANDMVAHDAPWAFMTYLIAMEVTQPYVKNYHAHSVYSQDYRFVWLDEPRRKVQ